MNKSTEQFEEVGFEIEFLNDELRLLDRYELQDALVETLGKTKHHRHLVPLVAACHRSFRHCRCLDGQTDFAEPFNSCSVRVCPHDSRRRSLILAGRLERFCVGKMGSRYLVLAERNSENLAEGLDSLWRAWTRLRRSVCWKRKVKGCIVALEVTRNREEGTWHPHLNVLMEGDHFPFDELNQAWIQATEQRGQTSYIRAFDTGTVRELVKYVTKLVDLIDDAPALDEFLLAVKSKRLVRTYGSFYRIPVEDEENPGHGECPDCGSKNIVRLGFVKPQQVSLDFKGILRVTREERDVDRDFERLVKFEPDSPSFGTLPFSKWTRSRKREWQVGDCCDLEQHAGWKSLCAQWKYAPLAVVANKLWQSSFEFSRRPAA